MAWTGHGRVEGGAIVLTVPVPLPEGTEVIVQVVPSPVGRSDGAPPEPDFSGLPFFGMYRDRPDLEDSAAWVRREREQWHRRAVRPD